MFGLKTIKSQLSLNYLNYRGWKTKRKIIVIESDDWGSIRMPSKDVYKNCLKNGYEVDKVNIEKFDSLESEEDLSKLFDLLIGFKDFKGNPPVFTANCLVANPDFERIKQSDFKNYHFELVTSTFNSYPNHKNSFELWNKGFDEKIFFPQSHGREHLNVSLFLNALQSNDKTAHFAFNNRMPGIISMDPRRRFNFYVEALNFNSHLDKLEKLQIVLEGLDLFKNIFKYDSLSFIPPNYIWSNDFNYELSKKNVQFFQGTIKMKEPDFKGGFKKRRVVLGSKNAYNQIFLTRNCFFEPSTFNFNDHVGYCLKGIAAAFDWGKPAIINSHRVNYIGSIFPENRDKNLFLLKDLIGKILIKWPDVEFLTSPDLGKIIKNELNEF